MFAEGDAGCAVFKLVGARVMNVEGTLERDVEIEFG